MKDKIDFKQLADAALMHAKTLVPDWLPAGRLEGHEWRAGNVRGDPGKSLAVNLNTGVWADFSSGEKGADLISLYAAIFTGNNQGKAARELADRLNIHTQPDAPTPRPVKKLPVWQPILPVPGDAGIAPVAHSVRGRPESRWEYLSRDGSLLGYVCRFRTSDGGKEVLPCVYAQKEGADKREWRWMHFPEPRPLYGLNRLVDGPAYVLVVEGEKCADAAHDALGFWLQSVSWPGGGNAVKKADWTPLRGRKVIIWPDCDAQLDKKTGQMLPEHATDELRGQPGIKAAEDIAQILLGLGCEVRIVDIPKPGQVADGWDIADAVQEGWTPDQLKSWIVKNLREPRQKNTTQDQNHANTTAPAQASEGGKTPGTAGARHWKSRLLKKPRGGYEDCKENVSLALEHHPELQGLIGYNDFSARIEKTRQPPWGGDDGEWTQDDDLELSMWLASQAELLFRSTSTIGEGVRLVASRNKHHPVREWLQRLVWDGQDRLSCWLSDCLGVANTEYASLVGTLWIRQAVNRILNPGCKGDYVLILEGTQGLMKSSALRVLGGEWFSDAPLDLNSKDAFMSISGAWIYEIAELDAFNRTEATRIKAFITQAQDRYRPPYGSRMINQPRQVVFAATTNNYEYHKDPTGNRRFWSVLCTRARLDLVKQMRDQLFAQAVYEVLAGEPVYPTRDQETRLIAPEQQMREIVDPWHETIAVWLDEPERAVRDRFTSADILTGAIKMEIAKIDGQRSATTRVGSIMTRLGWKKVRESSGPRTYFYVRPERPTVSASQSSREDADALPI